MNDGTEVRVHCGTPMQPCRGCGEARCLTCDPYRAPERECGVALLLEVATA